MSAEFWMALSALIGVVLIVLYLIWDWRESYEQAEDLIRGLARRGREK